MEAPGPGEVRLRLATGGVCGSDLHYYNHGGFGAVRLREPMILGHEVSAIVGALGKMSKDCGRGSSLPCRPRDPAGPATTASEGLHNQCLNMRFYGSAMPFPHIQGAFREVLVADAIQCVPADGLTPGEAAMAEPLAVTLHATRRAGEMLGKRVLVTGCGPIGVLAILCAPARRCRRDRRYGPLRFHLALARKARRRPDDQHGQRTRRADRPMRPTRARSMCSTNAPAPRRRWRPESRRCGRAA